MNKLNDMIIKLEQAGVDTSQFTIILNDGTRLVGKGNQHVEDVQLQNEVFRRWITAQTFHMLYERSYNAALHRYETGWYNYLKNNYDYMYQFKVILDELKVLAKLEKKPYSDDFEDRQSFFTKDVIRKTCEDCCYKLSKSLGTYATVQKLMSFIPTIAQSRTYADMKKYVIQFYNTVNRYSYLLKKHTKCSAWLDAYKGAGAFYSLQNMILYHGCKLPGFNVAPQKQYKILRDMLLTGTPVWQFHDLLLRTIEYNHFDLGESIRKHQ